MSSDKFITLAIHTYDYAVGLRRILSEHGVESELENVDMADPKPASGVRVRILEADLPLALKLVESPVENSLIFNSGGHPKLLIPTDFSPLSLQACRVGFFLAELIGCEVMLLHVYATPYFDDSLGSTDSFVTESVDNEVHKTLEAGSRQQMRRLEKQLRSEILEGKLPAVRFFSTCVEGLPEDAILEYARENSPQLIVMGTRGADRKATDLVGSVTAEVVDSCRVPVFTVPEHYSFDKATKLEKIVFFCNLDHQDLLAMDAFLRLSLDKEMEITLIPAGDASSRLRSRMDELRRYFSGRYTMQTFHTHIINDDKDYRSLFERYVTEKGVEMLVVPNKKKNIFSRLFNPGIAHKILFEKDIPMLVLPV